MTPLFKRYFLPLLTACSLMSFSCGQISAQQTTSLREGFQNPPEAAKLRCYWWWLNGNTTADTITRDLEGMKAKGYAGAILVDADGSGQQGNIEVPVGPSIGSPQWMALFLHALDVAQKLDLEISLNVTSRWDVGIIGGPTVKPEDALQLLTWSETIVNGGGSDRTVDLAAPPLQNNFFRPIAVLAYPLRHGSPLPGQSGSDRQPIANLQLKTASREIGFSMPSSDRVMRNQPSVAGEEDAAIGDVIDLSSRLDKTGNLQWIFPPGTWEVLRIGYTDTAMHLIDSSGTPLGLPLDAMSPEAFDHYWRDFVTPLLDAAKPYIGTSLRYLVTDSWEAGGTNWTTGFREEFQRRRGYDPIQYLPIVTGRILTSRDASNRFLFDLRRTVADLITENYYDRFAQHAKEKGLGTHPESGGPHGAPIDALETFRSSSFPQTEFWDASATHRVTDVDRFFVKEASSAAHIYGKPFVAAEGLTSMNLAAWSESIGGNLQPTFDHALTEGLNRLFWHEFTSSPAQYGKPGQEYFAGTHLNPNVTWWDQAAPFLLGLNRSQFLMQQGEPVSDLLYFYGDQTPSFVRVKSDDPAHVLPGYDYDVVDEDALLHRMAFNAADLHTPEGVHYRALALPTSRHLSFPALLWIERFVSQGGVIVGLKPDGPLGLIPADKEAEYKRTADALWEGCDGGTNETHYGQGRIYCSCDGRGALAAIGVAADFSFQINSPDDSSTNTPAFDYIHRKTASADIYFVRNTRQKEILATLSFRVQGHAPELWVSDDGTTAPALVYNLTADGRTEIPLTFPPEGSVNVIFERPASLHLVRIEKDGQEVFPSIRQGVGVFPAGKSEFVATAPGTYAATDSEGHTQSFAVRAVAPQPDLNLTWTLSFPASWGAPQSVRVSRFQSWSESPDPGIRFFSGTATYRTTLNVPADLAAPGKQLWLQFGQAREIATVTVNGKAAATMWRQPFAARIDPLLHTGQNLIEIEVTNLWPNRLIGDLQPSATVQFTHTNVHAYTKDSPLLPSGILEPVTLTVRNVEHWQ